MPAQISKVNNASPSVIVNVKIIYPSKYPPEVSYLSSYIVELTQEAKPGHKSGWQTDLCPTSGACSEN